MKRALLELVWERDELANLDPAQRRLALRELVAGKVGEAELGRCVAELAEELDGFGRLAEVMSDESITDVLVNGAGEVWVERAGALEPTALEFQEHEVSSLVDRLLADSGARADTTQPVADGRLSDGSRVNVVLPPLAPEGPLISIRRFSPRPPSLADLVGRGMLDDRSAERLEVWVRSRRTIAISGATSTGKTTLMNALLSCVPTNERVVSIEETPELRPACRHFVSLLARPPNVEGRGEIGMAALLRTSLRMRPDRIVVGEVRGPEALVALAAMSTGHEGSMVTIHARSGADALERMVTLAQQAGSGASEASLERQVHSALQVVVHLERDADRRRRVGEMLELA